MRNTGRLAGAEVVQAYLQFPATAGEPPRQLKAFAKAFLRPGQIRTVRLDLARSSFEFFDPRPGAWTLAPGRYRLYVGTSSQNLPFTGQIEVGG